MAEGQIPQRRNSIFGSLRRSMKNTNEKKYEGRWGDCSSQQLQALEDLKKLVPDRPARYDDVRLLRFLRARAFDVEKAKSLLEEDIAWRKKEGIDDIKETFLNEEKAKEFLAYYPRAQHGFSKDGLPVFFERFGVLDAKGIMASYPLRTLLRSHLYGMELREQALEELSKKEGKPRDEGIYIIFDLIELGWKHFYMPAINVVMESLKIDDLHYPELIKKLIIINAPSIFSVFWRLIKPMMDPRTVEKTEIYGNNFLSYLEKDIDLESFPRVFGGKCTCEKDVCIEGGGPIIETPDVNFKEVTVGARDVYTETVHISKHGATLAWEFSTVSYNIQFGIVYENGENVEESVPLQKVESHESSQSGSLTCKKGKYHIKWDNTHSMLRAKTLKFQIHVQDPAEEKN